MINKLFNSICLLTIALLFTASCNETTTPIPPVEKTEFTFLDSVQVGNQPAEIFFDKSKNVFHIFCLGNDTNWNGVFDEGDEAPSWWVINRYDLNNPQKVYEFDFPTIGFPFRPLIDKDNRIIYLSQSEKIVSYSLDNYSIIDDNIADYKATAISKKGDIFFFSISTGYSTPGYIQIYDSKTKTEIGQIEAGINVQKTEIFENGGKEYLAIMSEGSGANNSRLQFVDLSDGQFVIDEDFEEIGKIANHFEINNNRLALTLNASHQVLIIDLVNFSFDKNIEVGTSGFDGPRESRFGDNNELYVTTYAGDVRIFDLNSNSLLKTLNVSSRAEGMALIPNDILIVCNISNLDYNYTPNNLVSIFHTK